MTKKKAKTIEQARQRAAKLEKRPTVRQYEYIEVLLNDCGYGNRLIRNTYLSDKVGREIHFITDLTLSEASSIIERLRSQRAYGNA